MTLTVVTPPGDDLVSIDELRAQLNLHGIADFDTDLAGFRAAAVKALESATQRRFLTQTVAWSLPGWPCAFVLPLAPVKADGGVVSIAYVDQLGVQQTLTAGADYVVSPEGPTVSIRPAAGATWPLLDPDAGEAVTVTFVVGDEVEAAPANVVTACMMLVAFYWRNRGDGDAGPPDLAASGLPRAVEALIGDERW